MAGRPPKDPALKLMTGRGDGKDSGGREVQQPVVFPAELPEPPKWLPTYAAEEWNRVGPQLVDRKMLKAADRASFAAYCLAWDRVVRAWEFDYNEFDPDDVKRVIQERDAASKELRQWAREFGLTTVAGIRLVPPTPPKNEDDPFV